MVSRNIAPWSRKVVAHEVDVVDRSGDATQIESAQNGRVDWQGRRQQVPRRRENGTACLQEREEAAALFRCLRVFPVDCLSASSELQSRTYGKWPTVNPVE